MNLKTLLNKIDKLNTVAFDFIVQEINKCPKKTECQRCPIQLECIKFWDNKVVTDKIVCINSKLPEIYKTICKFRKEAVK